MFRDGPGARGVRVPGAGRRGGPETEGARHLRRDAVPPEHEGGPAPPAAGTGDLRSGVVPTRGGGPFPFCVRDGAGKPWGFATGVATANEGLGWVPAEIGGKAVTVAMAYVEPGKPPPWKIHPFATKTHP